MSTPLANKQTISSRNKMAGQTSGPCQESLACTNTGRKTVSAMRPPSQIARSSRALAVATPSAHLTRIANLANGLPRALKEIPSNSEARPSCAITAPHTIASKIHTRQSHTKQSARNEVNHAKSRLNSANNPNTTTGTSRLPPMTVAKFPNKYQSTSTATTQPSKTAITSQSRLIAPQAKVLGAHNSLNSRSSSVLSSVSSSATLTNRQDIGKVASEAQKNLHINSININNNNTNNNNNNNKIPDTNTVRKGLAKFSNPIECQRQFQALSLKKRKLDEIIEARDNEIDELQEQLKHAISIGVGYATAVQYFALKLKIGSEIDLLTECEQLRSQVNELKVSEKLYEQKLEAIVDDYKNHLQVEKDLRNNIETELDETRSKHSELVDELNNAHTNEIQDLNSKHSDLESQLRERIGLLESELETKSKDLSNSRKEYENLNDNFNKLEESLTKDKDARMKYAQEKISQLQKDVESLNSVLEMRLERIHALEKDSLLLAETQNELVSQKDANKALNQQLESVNATLERKREQYENLITEHETLRQELKKERKERRRMTMRTEQLEFVLNESCASENNMVFNSSF